VSGLMDLAQRECEQKPRHTWLSHTSGRAPPARSSRTHPSCPSKHAVASAVNPCAKRCRPSTNTSEKATQPAHITRYAFKQGKYPYSPRVLWSLTGRLRRSKA
jgi:hypothetical protein